MGVAGACSERACFYIFFFVHTAGRKTQDATRASGRGIFASGLLPVAVCACAFSIVLSRKFDCACQLAQLI